MAGPLDAVIYLHRAIRADIAAIDEAAHQEIGPAGVETLRTRFDLLNRVLKFHEGAEEEVLFPRIAQAVQEVAPLYVMDHRANDALIERVLDNLGRGDVPSLGRTTAALHAQMDLHLDKEEQHLLKLCDTHIPPQEHGALVGQMAGRLPQELFGPFVGWMFPLLQEADRAAMLTVWQRAMPEEVFSRVKGIVQGAIGDAAWADVLNLQPGLA